MSRKIKTLYIVIPIAFIILVIFVFIFRPFSSNRDIYHDYFFAPYSIRGQHAVIGIDYETTAIIDAETGRELMRFRDNRRYEYWVDIIDYNIAHVLRSRMHRYDPFQPSHQSSLINIQTGETIISLGPNDPIIVQVYNNMAVVKGDFFSDYNGIINLETKEWVLPIEFGRIIIISDTLAKVQLEPTFPRNATLKIIGEYSI
ncbi:MAG: hypothetical protein FWC69_04790 [Defluviitaleaceae bacterium]|nr:hypothetical protein [Defluviitaleaceae bacterium]